jgi:hypothetical protein
VLLSKKLGKDLLDGLPRTAKKWPIRTMPIESRMAEIKDLLTHSPDHILYSGADVKAFTFYS